jgi:putative two-component system response regulator
MADEKKLVDALIKTMAELVDRHDQSMSGHTDRTRNGVQVFLEEMKKHDIYKDELGKLNLDVLLQSCMLYDVGKISIKDSILNKPGKLTNEEFSEMKKHTIYGEKIIEKIETMAGASDLLDYAKICAVSHHEKWDGTGYPRGLEGAEIPLMGRILAIVDVYEGLTSARPYKDPFTHEQAVEIISGTGGTLFDPKLIEVFELVSTKFKH